MNVVTVSDFVDTTGLGNITPRFLQPWISKITVCVQGLHGICLYFLRTGTTKAVTIQNIAQEVNFGTLDCTGGQVLSGMEKHLSKIVLPALKSLEVSAPVDKEGDDYDNNDVDADDN